MTIFESLLITLEVSTYFWGWRVIQLMKWVPVFEIARTVARFASSLKLNHYSVFHQFRQDKFVYRGLILSSSSYLLLPHLPQKIKLALKVVKIDTKIIISKSRSKSVKLFIVCPNLYCTLFMIRIHKARQVVSLELHL